MRVIANRQLRGEYGTVVPDQEFDPRDEVAEQLLKSGLVRYAFPPRIEYETKVIVPTAPEVSPREPFRDLPLPDQKPQGVAPEGDPLFSAADLSQDRITDPRGRGRRSGPRSRG